MKLHANETVVGSHVQETNSDGSAKVLVVITSFGRVFHYMVCSSYWSLLNDRLAS